MGVVAHPLCAREDRLTLEPGAFVSNLAAMLASRLPSFAKLLAELLTNKTLSTEAEN
jgi:hypothetical protein